ncbi:hypothetical protein RF11_15015 [Thelohanellus kitauei]|uniref:Uncharacterized protein n=1 Tax=Thelohanellus kitauei TaxID=669202 RepID=A0A0C2MQ70_THEKT|nr:hypothetical protein RF11_15015 [Thelohanellus kitauei]
MGVSRSVKSLDATLYETVACGQRRNCDRRKVFKPAPVQYCTDFTSTAIATVSMYGRDIRRIGTLLQAVRVVQDSHPLNTHPYPHPTRAMLPDRHPFPGNRNYRIHFTCLEQNKRYNQKQILALALNNRNKWSRIFKRSYYKPSYNLCLSLNAAAERRILESSIEFIRCSRNVFGIILDSIT